MNILYIGAIKDRGCLINDDSENQSMNIKNVYAGNKMTIKI